MTRCDRRFIAALLAFIMLCALLPTTTFAAVDEVFTVQSTDAVPADVKAKVLTEPSGSTPGTAQVGNGSDLAVDPSVTSVTLPEVITHNSKQYKAMTVGDKAFQKTSLRSVSLPEVTSIGNEAFLNCDFLKSLSLPKTTSIGSDAFYDCDAIEDVTLPEVTSIGEYAFSHCDSLKSVSLSNVAHIGDYAFSNNNILQTVSLPKATSIGTGAFVGCGSLQSIFLPEVTSIGNDVLANCTDIVTVSLPKAMSIGISAFNGCIKLATVSLPKVTSIENNAFTSCESLASVTIWQTNAPRLIGKPFYGVHIDKCTLYVPHGAAGYNASGWPSKVEYLWPVSGTVYGSDGAPAADATVSVDGTSTQTDASGAYTVYVKPNYTGTITAQIAGTGDKSITVLDVQKALTGEDICFGPVATPAFSPAAGEYIGTQNVTITCATPPAEIHYTTNGDEPTQSSAVYLTPISVMSTPLSRQKPSKAE